VNQALALPAVQQKDRGFISVRTAASTAFEQHLFAEIQNLGFGVALNGTEHTHPDFVSRLHGSIDQTSLAIRYQPDAVACIGKIPRSFYVEAKAAKNIEKTAYKQYRKLQNSGNILVVVFEKLDWRWNFVEDVQLIDGNITVSSFPISRRFPVDDEGWLCPRQCHWWHRIKARNPQASGTPYREVNQASLLEWAEFKRLIIERLTEAQSDNQIRLIK
jgi:hypothetical protein